MYTIGRFSRIGMVSPKTLRFYDEIGLLKPAFIDEWNSYRYYSEDQIADILFINEMRDFGFTLDEIRILLNGRNPAALEEAYRKRLDELLHEEQRVTYIRRKLKTKLEVLKGTGDQMKTTEPMRVKVVTLEQGIKSVGVSVAIESWPPQDPAVFGQLWGRYWEQDVSSQIPDRKFPSVRFGILAMIGDSIQYLITDEVTSYEKTPDTLVKYDIPPGKYAVCTFSAGTFENLVGDALKQANDYLNTVWLPQSGCKYAGTFALEVYDERSRQKDFPEMDLYEPVAEN